MRAFLLCITTTWAMAVVAQEEQPGYFKIPGSEIYLKPGGYVKLDYIHDFNPIGSQDFFDISTIPLDGSTGTNAHLNAKESRISLEVKRATPRGTGKVMLEGDFYGANGTFRLRLAYAEWNDRWLVGQYWSNFMDEDIIPATLDFEKPTAYLLVRQPMVRFKTHLSPKSYLAFSVEEPTTKINNPPLDGSLESPWPDITGRYRLFGQWGHVQLSAFFTQISYRYDSTALGTSDLPLYGLNLSGMFNLFGNDQMIYQVAGGTGIGRYRGMVSAGPDATGELSGLQDLGITVGYQHNWSKQWSSYGVYNLGLSVSGSEQGIADDRRGSYLAVNTIYRFLPYAWVGLEYLHGRLSDGLEGSGQANRLQMSVKYMLQ
jgi:hypothetical protein